jgi:hypothetical protein
MAVLANQIQKLNQPIFDKTKIDEWKKKAPKFYSKFKGVTYIDTKILNRSLVVYDPKEQVRQLKVIMENVPSIKKSFENGIQYDEQPPSVEEIGKIHSGRSGWTRDVGFDQLNWDHYFYDVLEFDSPECREKYKVKTNSRKAPRTYNTTADHYRNITTWLDKDIIPISEKSIRETVYDIYIEGNDDDREKMIGELMSYSGIPIGDIRTFHSKGGTNSTQEYAEKNNYPHGGDKNKKVKEIGYTMHSASAMGTWLNMLVKAWEHKRDCEARAYIKQPVPAEFDFQRETFWNVFLHTKEKLEKVILNCVYLEDGKIKVRLPVLWKGFYAQKINPSPEKGGNPTEEGCVDSKGKPLK